MDEPLMATNELAPQSGIMNNLYKQVVPVNARTLIGTVMGDTSPITEANFSPDELTVLRNIYDAKRNRLESFDKTKDKTKDKTSVSYNDYPDQMAAPTFDSWVQAVKKSFTDPAYRVKTTLGSFNVNETPGGPVVTDKYNFDAQDYYRSLGVDFKRDSAYDMWKKANGPVDFLDMLMSKYAPTSSRPVNINLGKR